MTTLDLNLFDSIAGLPVHPLVVHFAVVLLPLAALALVILVIVPRWADRFGWVTLAALAGGTAAAFVAKESGEALAAKIGEPAAHATYGDWLPPLAVALLLVAVGWFILHRRAAKAGRGRTAGVIVAGALAAVLALGVTGLTVAVGHTGAQAAWGDVEAEAAAPAETPAPADSPSASAAGSTSASPTASPTASSGATAGSYSLAEVAKHADANSCWSAVNGKVYDLTKWINQHPGGPRRILAMCGKDASDAFNGQHGGQARPEKELAGFEIGTLS
ncbi:cytochrome b5-like protein [Propionicimonas paludicola]|uniref:Cytochrome b5-like protein n=1 Tax=Propionicimonas paludicola TaxID=185243 RepID=A0A2A9CT07_9ACTN|nr:cytochrome b5-like heme/steroid binding domain-containing protein [Propionicimonas paludicola]PFG17583.1 cytochrome b5-like protein [Propionicimonas paludicola]